MRNGGARELNRGAAQRIIEPCLDENAVPAELAAALGDDQVRIMALRAAGLSDRSLRAITDMIDSARSVEGLPD